MKTLRREFLRQTVAGAVAPLAAGRFLRHVSRRDSVHHRHPEDPPTQESNICYTDRVQTPLMIVQGDMNYVAIQQGEKLFASLY